MIHNYRLDKLLREIRTKPTESKTEKIPNFVRVISTHFFRSNSEESAEIARKNAKKAE